MFKIVPAIDIIDGQCVRLEQGDYSRQTTYNSSPVDMAKEWQDLGAELIHIVDLDAAKAGRPINLEVVEAICNTVSIPCELGGGIREFKDAKRVLEAGISRLILGSALIKNPLLTERLLEDLEVSAIVAGLDAKDGMIAVHGWLEKSNVTVLEIAADLYEKGIRNFIYTDISTDGMGTGPNCPAQKELCEAVPEAQVIASGGIGTDDHITELLELRLDNLEGVIVGKALYDKKVTFQGLHQKVIDFN
ncbi:MAG: 1-(5-phosphoribosyl)-5-[(5-phosphoribosylamino)methylideneamino]imidazole-4-carboxamide isomerase [Lentisphaeria bacterium]|nr:1-(5-phosphoribosyl)-5-[(5-phosphoribosylamino)methylideneamino]imidazole-4-carboxamide isomerase [Lentisphaeria bacterium]